jgi:ABC-type nitrate/sulfonate/bicarbonate transport system substrate-binding protein
MRSRTARGTAVVIATAAALALAGCAGEASPGDTKGPAETITIEVGTLPVIETALIMVGEEQGLLSKHNMKLN